MTATPLQVRASQLLSAGARSTRASAWASRVRVRPNALGCPSHACRQRVLGRVAIVAALVCSLVANAASRPATMTDGYLTHPQAVEAAFPGAKAFVTVELPADPVAQAAIRRGSRLQSLPRSIHEVRNERGGVLGWAIERDVTGKSEPITYLLAVDTEQRVHSVEILAYRESHGGEIRREAFRRQFVGKTHDSLLALGRDVRNITGATLSCRAITDGVHDDLLALRYLLEKNASATRRDEATTVEVSAFSPIDTALFRRAQVCMGTQIDITIAGVPHDLAERASSAAFAEARRLDDLLSHYKSESDVSRIARAGPQGAEVAADTFRIIEASKELSERTGGAFDPCLGAAVELWKDAVRLQVWPTPRQLEEAHLHSGLKLIHLDPARKRIALKSPLAKFDLGGIGKGYALDRMATELRAHGVNSALLNFGGQILALDPPPDREGWTVEIGNPVDRSVPIATLRLSRASVATSGSSEQVRSIGVEPVSHILDPRTIRPVNSQRIATTIAVRATDADAWSTAAFVLDSQALALAEAHGVGVMIATPSGSRQTNALFQKMIHSNGELLAAPRR